MVYSHELCVEIPLFGGGGDGGTWGLKWEEQCHVLYIDPESSLYQRHGNTYFNFWKNKLIMVYSVCIVNKQLQNQVLSIFHPPRAIWLCLQQIDKELNSVINFFPENNQ